MPNSIPVIIGVGQSIHREDGDWAAAEPLELMVAAAMAAQADCEARALALVDRIEILRIGSWRYADAAALVAQRLGVSDAHGVHHPVGGETPLRVLDGIVRNIMQGTVRMALVVGAEGTRAVDRAEKAGVELGWTPRPANAPKWQLPESWRRINAIGIERAMHIFALYENALRAHEGIGLAAAQDESAELWAALSRVAAGNEWAWTRRPLDAGTIATATDHNRRVAHPFLKLMTANPWVNQGAALLVTDTDTAQRIGVPRDRWVYPWGSAGADEPSEVLGRECFYRSAAVEYAINRTQGLTGTATGDYDVVEQYSCFPTMPKLSGRVLGAIKPDAPSVTGGLSFFGGPGSNYLTHAIAAMVERLRGGGELGFIHGVGEMMTKHHGLVLGAQPRAGGYAADPAGIVAVEPPPVIIEDSYEGVGTIETHSINYGRDGQPEYGIVIGRGEQGQRFGARIDPADAATVAACVDPATEAVGLTGRVVTTPGGSRFRL